MFYSIEKLREKDWCLDKYLKEIAIRNYGLCIFLRDDDKEYSEEELKEYFKGRDNEVKVENKELPKKPTEAELEKEYPEYLERTSQALQKEMDLLKNLTQMKFRISKALKKLDKIPPNESKKIVENELNRLYTNILQEITSSTNFAESLLKPSNFEDFKKSKIEEYERKVKRIKEENEKEVEPLNLLAVYEEYVDLVNSLEI